MNPAITKRAFVKFASGIQVSLNHQLLKDLCGALFEGGFGEGCYVFFTCFVGFHETIINFSENKSLG